MVRHITGWEQLVVEYRVLPFWRFVRDQIYWIWLGVLFSLPHRLVDYLMFETTAFAGCRGYFEWRDSIEYPQIGRFASMRWTRWRNAEYRDLA